MSFESLLFYVFGAATLLSALGVITVRNPVHAVLLLVLTFFNSALVWVLLRAEFLGIALILVYVGAVMVLFLFVVMMLDINVSKVREGFSRYLPVGFLIAVIMAVELSALLGARYFLAGEYEAIKPVLMDGSNTQAVGHLLFTRYVFQFEVASLILLVAAVAAVTLTLRRRTGVRVQHPGQQAAVKFDERLAVVKMSPEKPLE
jgi:NADH-quinone oxidoreductase subunit J